MVLLDAHTHINMIMISSFFPGKCSLEGFPGRPHQVIMLNSLFSGSLLTSAQLSVMNFWGVITFYIYHTLRIHPNWHETGHFYPPCNFGIGFCIENFQTFFEVKIDINWVNLTPCQAH